MARRGTSILLIPLLGFLALLYPVATQRTPTGSSPGQVSIPSGGRTATVPSATKTRKAPWHGDRRLLAEFLGPLPGTEGYSSEEKSRKDRPGSDAQQKPTIGFMVATVPDPSDSGLPYLFDRFLSSIQAAVAADDYVLDRFDLPWLDVPQGKNEGNQSAQQRNNPDDNGQAEPDNYRRFETEPGVILFRQRSLGTARPPAEPCPPEETKPEKAAEFRPDLLILYVIGETPTGGVQKNALMASLREIEWFRFQRKQSGEAFPNGYPRPVCGPVKIMGPSFTGSVPSLEFTLTSWLDSYNATAKPFVQIISGSATSVQPDQSFKFGDTESHFSATAVPDRVTMPRLLKYFGSVAPCKKTSNVALLIEGNTAYGRSNSSEKITNIPFPLHISQLRAASEKQRRQQQQASQQAIKSPLIELPLEDSDARHDSIRALSDLDLPSGEQILANLLSTISRDGFQFVGILATDARDAMFLSQEVHEHNPSAVLFTVNPDLLYLHPEINLATRGMLIFTSYPLFNANQLWSFPNQTDVRLQFPDSAAEGAYNAALVLLDRPDLLVEYGLPFERVHCLAPGGIGEEECNQSWPPLWISVVGRDALWPLAYAPIDPQEVRVNVVGSANRLQPKTEPRYAPYLEPIIVTEKSPDASGITRAWLQGMYPQNTILAVDLFSVACVLFCLLVILSRMGRSRREALTVAECAPESARDQAAVASEPKHAPFLKRPLTAIVGRLREPGSISLQRLGDAGFLKPLAETVFEGLRRQAELFLLAAVATLGFFQLMVLLAFALPAIGLLRISYGEIQLSRLITFFPDMPCGVEIAGLLGASNLIILATTGLMLATQMRRHPRAKEDAGEKSEDRQPFAWHWVPIGLGATFMLGSAYRLWRSWLCLSPAHAEASKSLFTGLRLLSLQSGVSPMPPLFFISCVGFLWALTSFQRARQLENLAGWKGIFCAEKSSLNTTNTLERRVQCYLHCPSVKLPGALVVIIGAVVAGWYLFGVRLVRSFDAAAFYFLFGVSFTFANLALWLGILRFCLVWRTLETMLRQLSWHPLREALRSYRRLFPAMPRIDLTTPSATTTSLAYSVEQARAFWQTVRGCSFVISPEANSAAASAAPAGVSNGLQTNITTASNKLAAAVQAEAEGRWRDARCLECASQLSLAAVSKEVTTKLDGCEWLSSEDGTGIFAGLPKEKCEAIVHAGEAYLVTRLVHFLSCVFPQLQNLVYCSAVGLILLLLAVSFYPLQPRGIFLLFNWAVILSFVGIAMLVFVRMNRNVVLSTLNGTTPGQINWDREFVFRLFFYGAVPLLALLGAQFPESVGDFITRILPASGSHP